MKRNVTIKLDERLLKKSRHAAVEEDLSLSDWVAGLVAKALINREALSSVKRSAIELMEKGLDLGGKPLSRESLHER